MQFGLNYGITNRLGEIDDKTMSMMLEIAEQAGINIIDTASDYGDSQIRLGKLVNNHIQPKYVSKFSLSSDGEGPTSEHMFLGSMQNLRVSKLHGLLFHKIKDLQDPRSKAALDILKEAKANNQIELIGVSVYNLEELKFAIDIFPDLDIVQIPANIFDTRLLDSSTLATLKLKGVQIHVRSIFLQGILLSNPEDLSNYFDGIKPALRRLREISRKTDRTPLELILGNMRANPQIDAVIVGATTAKEIGDITSSWRISEAIEKLDIPEVPTELLDPRNWPKRIITK